MPLQSSEIPNSTNWDSRLSTSLSWVSWAVEAFSKATESSSFIHVQEWHKTAQDGAKQSSCPSCHPFKSAAVSLLLMVRCMFSVKSCTMTSLYNYNIIIQMPWADQSVYLLQLWEGCIALWTGPVQWCSYRTHLKSRKITCIGRSHWNSLGYNWMVCYFVLTPLKRLR